MYKTQKKSLYKRPLVFVAFSLLALLAVFAILELTNTTHILHKKNTSKSPVSAGQSTKGESGTTNSNTGNASTANNTSAGTTNNTQSDSSKNKAAPSTNLIVPTGNFVSAHKSVPTTAALSSVCNTTVGAACQIVFTSGNLTKSLMAQTTDSGGATYWNSWTPNGIGLTPGTWQVKAVATLGGQTKTSTDATNLEITP